MQYSGIPLDTHANQTFTHLEQGYDELHDNYLHYVSDLLLKLHHTSDMSRVSVEGTKHYAVVYGLNCRKLKGNVAGHESAQWKMIEECFRDICNIGVGYE